MGEKI